MEKIECACGATYCHQYIYFDSCMDGAIARGIDPSDTIKLHVMMHDNERQPDELRDHMVYIDAKGIVKMIRELRSELRKMSGGGVLDGF